MAGKGAPKRRTISIHCAGCRTLLYKYRKGGTGGLVKCHPDRIAEDFTQGDLRCPSCGQRFARPAGMAGKQVHKIIGGKIFTRGMTAK
jgi:ribosomal protein S27E